MPYRKGAGWRKLRHSCKFSIEGVQIRSRSSAKIFFFLFALGGSLRKGWPTFSCAGWKLAVLDHIWRGSVAAELSHIRAAIWTAGSCCGRTYHLHKIVSQTRLWSTLHFANNRPAKFKFKLPLMTYLSLLTVDPGFTASFFCKTFAKASQKLFFFLVFNSKLRIGLNVFSWNKCFLTDS